MKKLLSTGFCLLLTISLFAGCGGGGSAIQTLSAMSPQPRSTSHVYVGSFSYSSGLGTIYVYDLPITTTSAPAAKIAFSHIPRGMAFDVMGRLFVADQAGVGGGVQVFAQPISAASVPAFIFGPGATVWDVKVDSSGDAVAVNSWCGGRHCSAIHTAITGFGAPLTSQSAATFSMLDKGGRNGIAIDANGNLWVDGSTMAEYRPPFSSGNPPALQFAISGNGDRGIAFDSQGNLYAVNGLGVDVYQRPFTASTTKAFTISAPPNQGCFSLAFDAAGKLYVTAEGLPIGSPELLVFSPPFSSTSRPVVTTSLPNNIDLGGIAVGP